MVEKLRTLFLMAMGLVMHFAGWAGALPPAPVAVGHGPAGTDVFHGPVNPCEILPPVCTMHLHEDGEVHPHANL